MMIFSGHGAISDRPMVAARYTYETTTVRRCSQSIGRNARVPGRHCGWYVIMPLEARKPHPAHSRPDRRLDAEERAVPTGPNHRRCDPETALSRLDRQAAPADP